MDIFSILREAKDPNKIIIKNQNDDTYSADIDSTDDVNDTNTEQDDSDTSTTDDNTDDSNIDDNETSTDYTEEVENIDEDNSTDDTSNDDNSDDLDNSSDTDEQSDGKQSSDNASDDSINKDDTKKNYSLMQDMINLYYSINNLISHLDELVNVDVEVNQICIQVKSNLTELLDYIFDYITNHLKSNTYVKNLYIYQYFIEAYKVNIQMLKKVKEFITTN